MDFSKFNARKVWVYKNEKIFDKEKGIELEKLGAILFDSELEADFYLKLVKEGKNKMIRIHVPYNLIPEFTKDGETFSALNYEADFVFYDKDLQKVRIVDVKGFETEEFLIKRKLFEYLYKDYHLEVLKFSKTTGWVELKDYKRIMKEKKKEKTLKAKENKERLENIDKKERKQTKDLTKLKEIIKKEKEGVSLTTYEKNRKKELLDRYAEHLSIYKDILG